MNYKIGNDTWEIKETAPSGLFVVYKNGKQFETQCGDGSEFETESGACYAVLNEYSYENPLAQHDLSEQAGSTEAYKRVLGIK